MAMSLAEITIALLIGGVLSIVYLIYRYVGLVYLKKHPTFWYNGMGCSVQLCTYQCHAPPIPSRARVGTYRGFAPIN